ncbi:MAG TPA: hypothetical protein VGM19_09895 [Armatimonadota bacterium]|jgi:hypothetical protein
MVLRFLGSKYVWLVFAVVCLALYTWRPNPEPDTTHYLDIARTLATQGQAATYHLQVTSQRIPDPDLLWPPGYPVLLSLCLRLGCTSVQATSLVSLLSHTAVVVLLLVLLRRPEWALLGLIVWLQLIWGCGVARMAMSEAPCFPLAVGALIACGFAPGGSRSRLLGMSALAGVLGGSAALTRWVGISVVPAFLLGGVLLAVLYRRDRGLRTQALVAGGGAALVSALIVLLWLARNHLLNGSLLGPVRPPSELTLAPVLRELLSNLSAGAFLPMALPLLLGLALAPSNRDLVPPGEEQSRRRVHLESSVILLSVWAFVYLALVLWQQTTTKMDPLGPRFLFAGYGAVLLVALLTLEAKCQVAPRHVRRLQLAACLLAPVLLLPGVGRALAYRPDPPNPTFEWVARHTPPDALLIGHKIWDFRPATGRTVLESGEFYEGAPALEGPPVAAFLRKHGDAFPNAYLIVREPDYAAARESFAAAGITLRIVHEDYTAISTQPPTPVEILQLTHWPGRAQPPEAVSKLPQ